MKKLFYLLIIFFCFNAKAQTTLLEEPLVHTVLFWLNNPESKEECTAFETAIKKLMATNPQGIQSHLGRVASTTSRGVVDSSFTYCYIMTFASIEAEAAYQNDPTHLRFIEEAQHLWKKVVVYDSLKND